MAPVFSNNATSLLAVAINTSVTTVTVQTGDAAKFPAPSGGDWFPITVLDGLGNMEIMRCTGRSGANLTVVRAQEGTTAQTFSIGARVDLRMTAAALAEFRSMIDGKSAVGHGHAISDTSGLQAALDGKSAVGHAHNAGDITGGTFADARMPVRIGQYAAAAGTADVNTLGDFGLYLSANGAANAPAAANHYILVLPVDGDDKIQFAWQLSAKTVGDTVAYFRFQQGGTWTAWTRYRFSQAELDARYFVRGETTAANPNLNTLTVQGSYRTIATPTNLPAGESVNDWNLLVFGNGNTRTQILGSYDTGKMYIRGGYDPGGGTYTWEAWRQLADASNVMNFIKGIGSTGYSTSNTTLTTANLNRAWVPYSANHTLTLPLANSVPAGTVLGPFKVISPIVVTLQRSGSDVFREHDGLSTPTSIALAQGQQCYLVSDGSIVWEVFYLSHRVTLYKGTFSAASQVSFTIPPGFREIKTHMEFLHSGSGVNLCMQLSTDGGSSWISASGSYDLDYADKGGGGWNLGQVTSSTYMEPVGGISTSPYGNTQAEISLHSARDSGKRTMMRSYALGADAQAPNAPFAGLHVGGWRRANEDNNAFRIYPGTGTFSGSYVIEGIV